MCQTLQISMDLSFQYFFTYLRAKGGILAFVLLGIFGKEASPKKKTSKILTYVKKALPYLPNNPIWTTNNLDIMDFVYPPSLLQRFGQIMRKVCNTKSSI